MLIELAPPVSGESEQVVEVVPRARSEQLQHAVGGVDDHPADEPRERAPVELERPARQQRHPCCEEQEVQDELDHPLRELRERLVRREVEEADQVDEQEGDEEREHDDDRARHAARAT